MHQVQKNTIFWQYLSQNQQDLITEGLYLVTFIQHNCHDCFKDYSFLVFPFAKAMEGYLKQVFLDAGFISHLDYISDHLRLGKLLSPHLVNKLGARSLYQHLTNRVDEQFAERIWQTWKLGRNQVFHYFSHNIHALSFAQATALIDQILGMMEESHHKLLPTNEQAKQGLL